MEPAVQAPLGGRRPHGLYVTETVQVTKVSLLSRFPSFARLASIAGVAIDIKNRTQNEVHVPLTRRTCSRECFLAVWGYMPVV